MLFVIVGAMNEMNYVKVCRSLFFKLLKTVEEMLIRIAFWNTRVLESLKF